MNIMKLVDEINDIIKVYGGKISDGSVYFHKQHQAEIWLEFPNEDEEGISVFMVTIKDAS